MPKYLIKGGYVLQWDQERKSSFPVLDILIENNIISKVGPDLGRGDSATEIIDATGNIVSPGFIDGHRHVFQAQLRGTVGDHAFLDYCAHLIQGRMTFLTAEDMYLAQLSGASEAIWCGVTTVMDHSHAVTSLGRVEACLKATIESGIRSIYCVAPFANPDSINPLVLPDLDKRHPEQIDLFKSLASASPLGGKGNDGRVTIGLGYDTMNHRPLEEAREMLQYCKDRDIPVTIHDVERFNLPSLELLRKNKLPLPAITLSHTCEPDAMRINFLRESGVGVVSTPETEMAMGHGHPSAFELHRAGVRTGLGIDVPGFCSGDMFYCMRLALQYQRARENALHHANNKLPNKVKAYVDEALYMGTLGGAAAIHREKDLGSLEPGKCADVLLIGTNSPSMVASPDKAPLLVMHCNPSDVEVVFINGEIVKRDNKLLRVDWDDISKKLKENREVLEERWKHVDWEANKQDLIKLWGLTGVLE